MTKLWIMSDLHVDDAPYELPPCPDDVDAVIIAGDVADGLAIRGCRWLRDNALPLDKTVIYVPGNHDAYGGTSLTENTEFARQLFDRTDIHVLDAGQVRYVGDIRIIGATLWTDFNVSGDSETAMFVARRFMPDYRSIDVGLRRLRPFDLYAEHTHHLCAIRAELEKPFGGPTVVVTHHAPHPKSLRNGRATDQSDASFASDLTDVIERYQPELWIHGHVHHSCAYFVGSTEIICNPRGYAAGSSENPDFDPLMVVEI